jgi:hypothetical protein
VSPQGWKNPDGDGHAARRISDYKFSLAPPGKPLVVLKGTSSHGKPGYIPSFIPGI